MIYEVRANIFFTTLPDAEDLVSKCVLSLNDAVVVHPDEPNMQICTVEIIKCYHDETPTKPCISCGSIHCP
jgi:hypothetical protein